MSKEYTVPLMDQQDKVWKIKAYGLEEITSNVCEVDATELSRILQVNPQLLVRPVGKVDKLIGSDCCQLLPRMIKTVGNLQLLENQFGYCVRSSMSASISRGNNKVSGAYIQGVLGVRRTPSARERNA